MADFPVITFFIACLSRVAPTPSIGPLPWLVAVKFHVNFTSYLFDIILLSVVDTGTIFDTTETN